MHQEYLQYYDWKHLKDEKVVERRLVARGKKILNGEGGVGNVVTPFLAKVEEAALEKEIRPSVLEVIKMVDEETTKFYDLVEQVEKLCRERGELSLAEVERMALAREIRPSAVLDELSITEDIKVDLAGGKVKCR